MPTNFNIPAEDAVAQRARLLKEDMGGNWGEVFEELIRTAEVVRDAREDDRKSLSLVAEELADRPDPSEIRRREAEIVAGGSEPDAEPQPAVDEDSSEEERTSLDVDTSPEGVPKPYASAPEDVLDDAIMFAEQEMPGGGEKLEQRKKALRASLEYLRDNGTARPADFKSAIYSNGLTGGYASAGSWWKNCNYKAMRALAEETGLLAKPDDQEGTWRWTG
jgi:hypothetical protein